MDELESRIDVRELIWELNTRGDLDHSAAEALLRRWPTWSAPLEHLLRSVLRVDGQGSGL